jgi:hypothetical protein
MTTAINFRTNPGQLETGHATQLEQKDLLSIAEQGKTK